jgi:hypothetical protein
MKITGPFSEHANHFLHEEAEPYDPDLIWNAKSGAVALKDMKIGHLYNTWRMLWNHAAPEEMKIGSHPQYKFSVLKCDHHFMIRAFLAMYSALKARWYELGTSMQDTVLLVEGFYPIRQALGAEWLLQNDYEKDEDQEFHSRPPARQAPIERKVKRKKKDPVPSEEPTHLLPVEIGDFVVYWDAGTGLNIRPVTEVGTKSFMVENSRFSNQGYNKTEGMYRIKTRPGSRTVLLVKSCAIQRLVNEAEYDGRLRSLKRRLRRLDRDIEPLLQYATESQIEALETPGAPVEELIEELRQGWIKWVLGL